MPPLNFDPTRSLGVEPLQLGPQPTVLGPQAPVPQVQPAAPAPQPAPQPAADPFAEFEDAGPVEGQDEFDQFRDVDGIDVATPEELAEDKDFSVVQFVQQNPEALNDPVKRGKLLEAYRQARKKGVTAAAIPMAIKAAPGVGAGFLKGARDLTARLIDIGLQPAANTVLGMFEDPQTKKFLAQESRKGQTKALAEIAAGSESAVFGLADLARKGTRKLLTSDKELDAATDEQLAAALLDDVAFADQAQAVVEGRGQVLGAAGLDADSLRKQGIEIDPVAVENLSFVDPVTLVAFWGLGKAAVGLGKAAAGSRAGSRAGYALMQGGKVIARTKTAQQAAKLGKTLGVALQRAPSATVEAAGAAVGAGARLGGAAVKKAAPLIKGGLAIGAAAKGAAIGGPVGAAAGLGTGAFIGRRAVSALGEAAKGVERLGEKITAFGHQVAGKLPKGRFLRTVDALKPIGQGAAIGAVAAAPLAIATDTDHEAAQLLAGGIALGGGAGAVVSGARGLAGLRDRYIGQRLLDPFDRTTPPQVPPSPDYGLIPAFDEVHRRQLVGLDREAQATVNGFREFFRNDGEIYLQDPTNYQQRVLESMELTKGAPLDAAELAAGENFARTHAMFQQELPTPAGPRKVVFLNDDAKGLTHDAGHLFETLLDDATAIELRQEVLNRYSPGELQAFKELYESRLGGEASLTPEQVASEIVAENFSAMFSNAPMDTLGTPRPLVERMAAAVARFAERNGIDVTGGRTTPNLDLKPSFSVIGMLENAVKKRLADPQLRGEAPPRVSFEPEAPLSSPEIIPSEPVGQPRAPQEPVFRQGGADIPLEPVGRPEGAQPTPAPRNVRLTPAEEVAGAAAPLESARIPTAKAFAEAHPEVAPIVDAIAAGFERQPGEVTPLRLEVLGAKEAQPGKPTGRLARLEERIAADAAEALGAAPESVRDLFSKGFIPDRFETVGKGANQKLEILGMSMDKVLANVNTVNKAVTGKALEHLVPYQVKDGRFTAQAWERFTKDLTAYTRNQRNGFRGDGRPLVRPGPELETFIPPENPNYQPTVLPENVGNYLNLLQGLAPPKTSRVTGPGVPGNIKGQKLAELNLRTTEAPAKIRLKDAEKQTFPTGETIQEVNPIRNELSRQGVEIRDLHEVNERLRVDRIQSVKPQPELPFRAPVTDIIRGGFLPATRFLPDTGKKPKGNPEVLKVARTYADRAGIEFKPTEGLSAIDETLMKQVADEFQAAEHQPNDPTVAASYRALVDETTAQYRAMEEAGVKVEPWKGEGEPYKNSAEMAADVAENNHLWFLKTDNAYGTGDAPSTHALLEPSGISVAGQQLLANDVFRAVHDYFGHAMEGTQFGPRGEFNAWRAHSEMFTPEAQGALAAETLAQNAWVNFGEQLRRPDGSIPKKGEEGFIPPAERAFGDQKMFVVDDATIAAAKNQALKDVKPRSKFLPAEPVEAIEKIGKMSQDEFREVTAKEGGLTGQAVEFGKTIKDPAVLVKLDEVMADMSLESKKALKNQDFSGAMTYAARSQFLREAKEAATGTGGIGKWLREADPNFVAPVHAGKFLPRTEKGLQLAEQGYEFIQSGFYGTRSVIVKKGGEWVGEIISHQTNSETAIVDNVIVAKKPGANFRGQGLGETLYRELGTLLQEDGVTRLGGTVVAPEPLGVRQKVFGDFVELKDALDTPTAPDEAVRRLTEARSEETAFRKPGSVESFEPINRISKDMKFLPEGTLINEAFPDEVRKVAAGEKEGETFNLDGTVFNPGDRALDVVTLASVDIPAAQLNADAVRGALEPFSPLLGNENVKPGLFRIQRKTADGQEQVSVDVNAVVDQQFRDNTEAFAAANNQESFYDLNKGKVVETGGDGKTVLSDPADLAAAVDSLVKGEPVQFPGKALPAKKAQKKLPLVAKSFITPDGEFMKVDRNTHDQFLIENSADFNKRYKTKIPAKQGKEDVRIGALSAGFVRVSYEPNNGRLVFEANAKKFGKAQRDKIFEYVLDNLDDIDNLTVSLVDDKGNVVKSQSRQFFLMDEDSQKMDSIPFVTEEGSGERRPLFLPRKQDEFALSLETRPRKPSKADRAKMNRRELREAFPEAVVPRSSTDVVDYGIVDSPLYKQAKTEGAAVSAFADRLVKKYESRKNDPETKLGEQWYDEFTPLLKERYGDDAQVFAELLAATSPNTTPGVNFKFADAAFRRWKAGDFDSLIEGYELGLEKLGDGSLAKAYEAAVPGSERPKKPSAATYLGWWIASNDLVPKQTSGKLFGMHSGAVLKVITRRWLDENRGPKTQNFVENLTGAGAEATIDLWAARSMREAGYSEFQDRWRILPENSKAVTDADFAFSQKAFAEAAKRVGLKPRQLQGALWFAEKKNWYEQGWGELDLGDYRTELKKLQEQETKSNAQTRLDL